MTISPIPIRRDAIDIFLQPGDFYFGDGSTRIRTLLGSCVAITLWHPKLRIGGMCHYMLPQPGMARPQADARYAGAAMDLFHAELKRTGTRPEDYQAKLFGGGRMFRQRCAAADIGAKNIESGRQLLKAHGFRLLKEHAAGLGHRNLVFDVASGDVWVKHVPLPETLTRAA